MKIPGNWPIFYLWPNQRGWQSFCPFTKMPLVILEGQFDLGHFAPPNLVSQNAPSLSHMLNFILSITKLSPTGGAK